MSKKTHQVGVGRNAQPKIEDTRYTKYTGGAPWPGHEDPSGPLMPYTHAGGNSSTAPHAHGYRHSAGQREGALRLSGSKGAHRIGRK